MTSTLVPYKGRDIRWNQQVEIYRNLRMKGGPWYSIKQNGQVIGHTTFFHLKDCFFVVKESGRQRVIKTGQKNVHAYVVGLPVGIATERDLQKFGSPLLGKYDLHGIGQFAVHENGAWNPVKIAMRARLDHKGLTIWMPRA